MKNFKKSYLKKINKRQIAKIEKKIKNKNDAKELKSLANKFFEIFI
jgi:hypothetical protein